jgi:antitoxin (DNA-binding transcriptional repressor) of toxin-antitoxin stability system
VALEPATGETLALQLDAEGDAVVAGEVILESRPDNDLRSPGAPMVTTGGDKCHPDWYHGSMKTVTIRDFRSRPKQVRDALKKEKEAVLTANGRPVALMIPVDAGSVDQALETLRRARGLEALRAIRRESRERGLDRLSSSKIDAIIKETRRARSSRTRKRG